MEEKNKKNIDTDKENFVSMSTRTTDMLEDPNQFYKDMAAMAAAIEKESNKLK